MLAEEGFQAWRVQITDVVWIERQKLFRFDGIVKPGFEKWNQFVVDSNGSVRMIDGSMMGGQLL